MNVQIARIAALLAASALACACAVVLGLDDHEPYPVAAEAGAPDVAEGGCGDTHTDPKNCGACGVVCANGYGCAEGICGDTIVSVAAGAHACVLLHAGEVWCWGPNAAGQVGARADNCTACPAPAKVAGITQAVELSVGVSSSCVRNRDGTVQCWGQNNMGQLGHAPASDPACPYGGACNPAPQGVTMPPAVQIAVGDSFACARVNDGTVRCWGDNQYGELGTGAPSGGAHPSPSTVAITSDVVDVAAGRAYLSACAVKKDGSIWCWGMNNRGLLGHTGGGDITCPIGAPTTACNATPSPVAGFSSFTSSSITRITCAASGEAGTYCWGFNGFGQLGLGALDAVDHATPAPVTIAKLASVSPGLNHACGLDADGAAWCWGYNFWGDVGDGTIRGPVACEGGGMYCAPKAVRAAGLPKIAALSAGQDVTVALGADGTVWSWGANPDGRTGHPPGGSDGGVKDDSCYLVVGDAGTGGPCTAKPARVMGIP